MNSTNNDGQFGPEKRKPLSKVISEHENQNTFKGFPILEDGSVYIPLKEERKGRGMFYNGVSRDTINLDKNLFFVGDDTSRLSKSYFFCLNEVKNSDAKNT